MNALVDKYLERHPEWGKELHKLRSLLEKSELTEEVKWGGPCYTYEGKNVVGLGAFKEHVALWFHQGALLKDSDSVLVNAQEGTTRALRQWRFRKGDKIPVTRVRAYIKEAVTLEKSGNRIKPQKSKPLVMPDELQQLLDKNKKLAASFGKLSQSKQREYAEHVSSAKRADTREKRLENIKPMILAGIGLNDKYR